MALVGLGGQDCIETRILMPRTGAWVLDAVVDDPDQVSTVTRSISISINDGALTLTGTAARAGVFVDTGHVRIVAGAGGLGLSAAPKHYNGVSVGVILGDLLAAAGEALSSTADNGILSTGLDAWDASATPIGTLISLLLAAAAPGASWRMLADGTLWVGTETWPNLGIDSSTYQIFEDSAEQNTMLIGVDAPLMLVGTTFEGRRVSACEAHVGQEGEGVQQRIWFEDAAISDTDRLTKALNGLVQDAAARIDRIDYTRRYPATVIQQSGSTVDVQPDQVNGRDLLGDMAGVPLWLPAGMGVSGVSGGRVEIGWLGGDPSKPIAIAFDASNTVQTMVLAVVSQLFLGGPGALPALAGTPHQLAEAELIGALLNAFTTLNTAATGPLAGLAPGFAAAVEAVTAYQTAAAAADNFLATKVSVL